MPKLPKKTKQGNKTRFRGHPVAPAGGAGGGLHVGHQGAPNVPLGNNSVTVTLHGTPITVPSLALGDAANEITSQQAQTLIQNNVNQGEQIFNSVIRGDGPLPPPSREDAAALLWYLKLVAERSVGSPFKKGAFTVPDPDGRLQAYLNRVIEVYLRSSTHAVEEQSATNIPSGIDYYTGKRQWDLLLPYGLNTVLFQSVFKTDNTKEQRLYFKFEGEGARFNTFNLNPFAPNRPDNAPKDTPAKFKDAIRSILHGTEVFFNTGNFGLPAYRENTPRVVTDPYLAAYNYARSQFAATGDPLFGQAAYILFQGFNPPNDPAKAGDSIRVHQIVKNFNDLITTIGDDNLAALDPVFYGQLQNIIKAIYQKYDVTTLENRFGDEVVVSRQDLGLT